MLFVPFLLGVSLCAVFLLARIWWRIRRSSLRRLRGPNGHPISGVLLDIARTEYAAIHRKWIKEYGFTCRIPSFLCEPVLFTADPRAVAHLLTPRYEKPVGLRNALSRVIGEGIVVAEGDAHKRARAVMNPCFAPSQLKEIMPIFYEKAADLKDIWSNIFQSASAVNGHVLDVNSWISRATMDIIGVAGFGYQFDSLHRDDDELAVAIADHFRAQMNMKLSSRIINIAFPWLRKIIPTPDSKEQKIQQETSRRIGMALINTKKDEIKKFMADEKGGVSKRSVIGRDLLTALIRANMATDLPESQRLSDEEVLAQINTLIIAGHETTSLVAASTLHALAQDQRVQNKLREEVLSLPDDAPSVEDISGLPYLDLVVREALRMFAPVPDMGRVAVEEDTIPLQYPVLDRNGQMVDSIRVGPRDNISISFMAINRSEEFWGPNAHEFVPERWIDLSPTAASLPGVYSHIMTFGAGHKACAGYRFSILEMKAVLFALLRSFSFEVAPGVQIKTKTFIITRPLVIGDEEKGPQLPLLVKPL